MTCMEKLGLDEDSVFGGPGWSRSVYMDYEEEVECGIKAAPLEIGTGAVELDGGKAKRPGLSMEVLR